MACSKWAALANAFGGVRERIESNESVIQERTERCATCWPIPCAFAFGECAVAAYLSGGLDSAVIGCSPAKWPPTRLKHIFDFLSGSGV